MPEIIAEVLINRPSKHLNRTFSYRVPPDMKNIIPGFRCIVPFAHRKEEGIIISLHKEDSEKQDFKILDIDSLTDSFPWFTPEMIRTANWISNYYMCTLIDALRLFYIDKKAVRKQIYYVINWKVVPEDCEISALVDRTVTILDEKDSKKLFDKDISNYINKGWLIRKEKISSTHKEPLEQWLVPLNEPDAIVKKRNRKQAELWDILSVKGSVSFNKARDMGFSSTVIRAFCLNKFGRVVYRRKSTYSLINLDGGDDARILTNEQRAAIDHICNSINRNEYRGILLKGVTGSGKTEVYLRAAEYALKIGGSALILVPEIALTHQMTSYFASVFGDKVVFMHSNLSKGERYNNRMRVFNGESTIIIGSRSAIFLPFHNLKLIVVDEEYDTSYKQGETPRYNGRDVAKVMATIYQCPIVLGAATPSISTFYAAKQGKIDLIQMNSRVFKTKLPEIRICDMRENPPIDSKGMISGPLAALLRETLANHQKAILLLNRRGFSTSLMCSSCGHVFKCPNCDVSMVYHKETHQLKCHYCETVHPVPNECPVCHSHKILYLGAGTERIEEELGTLLPEGRIRRFDLDSTRRKNSAREILDDFRKGEFDFLLGTQMVAKGHNIPGVQTVGILSADSILNIPSYLAAEQTFNLISQCAGRAGRSREQGKVILQTYNPEHFVIRTAASQDYESFYQQEIRFRRLTHFPPFLKLMKITCFNKDEKKAENQAFRIYSWLIKIIPQLKEPVHATTPFFEPVRRVRNLFYISILIKGPTLSALKSAMRFAEIFQENDIIIDVDPL